MFVKVRGREPSSNARTPRIIKRWGGSGVPRLVRQEQLEEQPEAERLGQDLAEQCLECWCDQADGTDKKGAAVELRGSSRTEWGWRQSGGAFRVPLPALALLAVCLPATRSVADLAGLSLPAPGTSPYGLAYAGKADVVWLVDLAQPALYQLELQSGRSQLIRRLPVSQSAGLCRAGGQLYLAARSGIYRLGRTGQSCELWLPLEGGMPTGLASDGRYLYVADGQKRTVTAFDLSSRRQVRQLPTPGRLPRGMSWHDGSLWLVDSADRAVYRLDPCSGRVLAAFVAPLGEVRGVEFIDGLWWFTLCKPPELVATPVKALGSSVPGYAMLSNPLHVRVRYVHTIENRSAKPIRNVEIRLAVPPQTARQQIERLEFDPEPSELRRDKFGQKIAAVRFDPVRPGQKVQANWTVEATLWAIRYSPDERLVRTLQSVPESVRSLFLRDAPVLQVSSPQIGDTARKLAASAGGPIDLAGAIRDYVMGRVKYVRDGRWDPAPVVLTRGTGSCSEYCYAFAALARASGLPVRFVGATALRLPAAGKPASEAKDKPIGKAGAANEYVDTVFHRWVEVYVPALGWLPVDANRDDRPEPPFPRRYFLALTERLLVLSKTSVGDASNLCTSYHSLHSCQPGENGPGELRVGSARAAHWTLLPFDRPAAASN